MEFPAIIVNFKNYDSATGEKALELAKICDNVARETGKNITVAVQHADIFRIAKQVDIPVFAQHIDPINFGSNTGFILPEAVKQAGASGTLLNHSEHQIDNDKIEKCVKRARELLLDVVICANDPGKGTEVSKFMPDAVAVEPPELIGGDISVSNARPEIISESVQKVKSNILVGAGVKNGKDVRKAMELGSKGILLASGITKAENPEKVLKDLVSNI